MLEGENKEPEFEKRVCEELLELLEVMETLRSPRGCPWDGEQDHESLSPYLLQEAYEVIEAIESEDEARLREELGDLLLQVVFHGQIAREKKSFDFSHICRSIKKKLIKRHPHVFGEISVKQAGEVIKNWEAIKRREKKERKSLLDGVSKAQPALLEASELQVRAAAVGFDWPDYRGALAKLEEELTELKEVLENEPGKVSEEIGDLLFAAVNVARLMGIDGEMALRSTNNKFRKRFKRIESELSKKGRDIERASLAEMDSIWEDSKEEKE